MYATDDDSSARRFISDVETIRARARQHMERGAVTPDYPEGRMQICQLLNEALATEIIEPGPKRVEAPRAAGRRAGLQSGDTARPQPLRIRRP